MLVHQLLVLTLQFGAISAERCWEQLARVPDFRGISRAEFDQAVEHMKKEDFLYESGGLLSICAAFFVAHAAVVNERAADAKGDNTRARKWLIYRSSPSAAEAPAGAAAIGSSAAAA